MVMMIYLIMTRKVTSIESTIWFNYENYNIQNLQNEYSKTHFLIYFSPMVNNFMAVVVIGPNFLPWLSHTGHALFHLGKSLLTNIMIMLSNTGL